MYFQTIKRRGKGKFDTHMVLVTSEKKDIAYAIETKDGDGLVMVSTKFHEQFLTFW